MSWQAGFKELTGKVHSEQAKWWLNGFWNEDCGEAKAEEVWEITHKFIELDIGRPVLYGSKSHEVKESSDLGEFESHRILELLGETMTVQALRKRLAALDIDKNNRMALSEYLLDHFKQKPADLVNSPQGSLDNSELDAAQAQMDKAQDLLTAAVAAKEACDIAEAPLKKANEELQSAVNAIKAIEDAMATRRAKLEALAEGGGVKGMRSKNELAQMDAEDPLPLRKAKITQKAALKRVEKARKPFAEATAAALRAKEDAEQAFRDANAALEELKSKGGTPHGSIWWMQRTLTEKQKYMPK